MSWLRFVRRHLGANRARTMVCVVAVTSGVAIYVGTTLGTAAVVAEARRTGSLGGQDGVEFFESIEQALSPLASTAMVVAGFIIGLTVSRTVRDRRVVFGTMRALGATTGTVVTTVAGELALVGVIGTIMGVGAGQVLGPLIGSVLAELFGVAIASTSAGALDPIQWAIALIGGCVVPPTVAAVVARRTAQVEPAVAIRAQPDERRVNTRRGVVGLGLLAGGIGFAAATSGNMQTLGAVSAMLGVLFGVPLLLPPVAAVVRAVLTRRRPGLVDIAAAQVTRRQGRTATSIGLITGTLAIVILAETVSASQRPAFVAAVEANLGADVDIPLGGDEDATDLRERLAASESVVAATPIWDHQVTIVGNGHHQEHLLVIDPDSYFDVSDLAWVGDIDTHAAVDAIRDGTGIVVSTKIAAATGVRVGEPLTLSGPRGTVERPVAGIFYGFEIGSWNAVVVNIDQGGALVDLGPADRILADVDFDRLHEQNTSNRDGILAVGGTTAARGPREPVLIPIGPGQLPLLGFTSSAQRNEIIEQFDGIFGLIRVLVLLTAVLGLIALANTLTMEVLDRRNEFAILRALGLHRRQVTFLVTAEGAIIAGIAAILATATGIAIGWAMIDGGAGTVNQLPIHLHVPLTASAVLIAAATTAGAAIAIAPARAVSNTANTALLEQPG